MPITVQRQLSFNAINFIDIPSKIWISYIVYPRIYLSELQVDYFGKSRSPLISRTYKYIIHARSWNVLLFEHRMTRSRFILHCISPQYMTCLEHSISNLGRFNRNDCAAYMFLVKTCPLYAIYIIRF